MKQKLFISSILLLLSFFGFTFCDTSKNEEVYSYQQTLEIYAITQYVGNTDKIFKSLLKKYHIIKHANQLKYNRSLNLIIKSRQKWELFIKDSIDYYINIIKNFTIKYYKSDGYIANLQKYNDNFLLEGKNLNDLSYWKVYFYSPILNDLRILFIQEFYQKNQIVFKNYYDENNRSQIKKEVFENNQIIEINYYHNGNQIYSTNQLSLKNNLMD